MKPVLTIKYHESVMDPVYLPTHASRCKPEWYKTMPYDLGIGKSNTKRCPGVVGGLTEGFIVYLPFDVVIAWQGTEYDITVPSEFTNCVSIHNNEQVNYAFGNKNAILKIVLPMSASCSHDIDFMYMYPELHNLELANEVTGPSGKLNFKHHNSFNAFLIVRLPEGEEDKTHVLKRGMPIAQFVPITEKGVEMVHQNVPDWHPRGASNVLGVSTYYDIMRHAKRLIKK